MKNTLIMLLGLMFIFNVAAFSTDQADEEKPDLSIGILSYIDYVYDLSTDADYNAFEINRNYIDIKYNYNDNIRFRLTPDFFRQGDGPLTGIIKYAYVEFKNPLGLTDQTFRLGMNPTAWESYMNDWWGFRWIEKTPSGTWKMTNSSDMGITLLGSLLNKFVSYQVSLFNGEGYNGASEQDSAKSFEATLELFPVQSIPLHLFGHVRLSQTVSEIESRNNFYAGAIYYKDAALRLGAEYMVQDQGEINKTLISIIGSYMIDQFSILGRYDIFDPSDAIDGNLQYFLIAGVGYRLSKNVQAMIDIKLKSYESDDLASNTKAYFHWEIKF